MVSSTLPSSNFPSNDNLAGAQPTTRRWVDLAELAVAYGLIEGALWTGSHVRVIWALAAMLWIVAVTLLHRPSFRELGLGLTGLRQTAPVAPLGILTAAVILLIARSAGTLHGLYGTASIAAHVLGYCIWALEQQFIAQSFIFTRLERALGNSRLAVTLTAVLFSVAHIPNSFLMTATLIGGFLFSEIFRRHRNIYPLAVAHAFVGLALAVAVPDQILRHLRVGIGFLHYH